ncbi:uncharacterized protein TRUGW13939_05294 [Talaromyces rugulosus]|uniref:Nephrocystin 3-like N-terminal domain-containing protein n=1 Tax=Talaromyces rugulosus TaxID=121627 RepID=A0A7H8QZL7_TALRU|nr:uncharacterized protein TRUGW13939_05294 [Talaromyces rugulosus]QKX58173.1 hypothetical protein TRUGW13939_05294 [Talaromyces rugulosus]
MSSLSIKRLVALDHDWAVFSSKREKLYDNGRVAREEYTVGWISALPLEMKAARAMLDDIHDDCESPPTDNNTYIFGSMAGHNCVIACLPAGIYGTTSATIVGNEMRHSFPNMQFCLLVGVAGGAPTENTDIRLGDVVAEFKRDIDFRISKLVSDMLQRHPEMRGEYLHRGQERDILFESEYEHLQGQATCDNCDQHRVRKSPLRASLDPTIHYGTIASGNQVIKHAHTRDKFAGELGNLCFEMEAAGLMDVFPCLGRYYESIATSFGRAASSALAFDQIEARYMTIKNAHLETCQWLLNHCRYKDWLNPEKMSEHHGFLWIKGKPAAGKSTIMKFIFTRTKYSATGTIIVSYFFNARGEELEKSVLGMYRSLLYQLLHELPHLRQVLDSIHLVSPAQSWSIEVLKNIFQRAVEQLNQYSLMCFIDALDECKEDGIRDMLSFFEQLGHLTASAGSHFRVCFSSRHYPHISISHGIDLTLESQDGHQKDITNYIHAELKAGTGKAVDEIRDELLNRASGIFLWVVLVVQMLNKEYDRGRIHALRKRLGEIPDGLHELFEDIITRNGQNTEQTVLCLQWILFARRPLSIDESYFAIISGFGRDERFIVEWFPELFSPEIMRLFVLDLSKGLAEITRSRVPRVQFIHESVRDFLLEEGGLGRIQSQPQSFTGSSHDRLKQCCMTYIEIDPAVYMPIKLPLPTASSRCKRSSSANSQKISVSRVCGEKCTPPCQFCRTIRRWIG